MSFFNPAGSAKRWALYGQYQADQKAGEARQMLQPYVDTGRQADDVILGAMGLGSPGAFESAWSQYQTSPGYQAAMDAGTQAIDRSAYSRGMGMSGRTLRDLTRFGQGLADQNMGGMLDRLGGYSNRGFTGLANQVGITTNQGQNWVNTANQIGTAKANQSLAQMGFLSNLVGQALGSARGGGSMGGGGGGNGAGMAQLLQAFAGQ